MAGRQRHSVNSQNTIRSTNTNSGSGSSSPLVLISSPSQVSSVGQVHQASLGEYYDSQSTDFQPPKRCPCWPMSYKITCVKSKGAILVLVLNFLVLTCADGAYSILLPSIMRGVLQHKPGERAWKQTLVSIITLLVYLFYPLAGWLADTFFGRYKTIVTSMWIVFFATLIMTVLILLHYVFPEDADYHQYIFPFLFVLMTIGLAGFQANVIPFGTDQLQDVPGQVLVAFVRWYVWTLFLSRGTVFTYYITCVERDGNHKFSMLMRSCAHTVCISLALALYFLFQHWLTKEPAGGNPLTTIFQVFNYARKHHYARLRSAFTYWDGEMPSRIDFAKTRYGGPFSTDKVEDVKTFYRMLCVLISVLIIFIAIATPIKTLRLLANHMSNNLKKSPLASCLLQSSLENLPVLVPVLSIPFFHFLVNPFIQNCWPTSLKRIGFGSLLFTAGILCAFILDTVGHTVKTGDFPCLFSMNTTIASDPIPLDYHFILLPGILCGLAWPVLDIGAYEFICAQTPQNMKGLFFGILYCVFGIGSALGFLIMLPFSLNSSIHWPVSCGFWYYLINILISLTGFTIFCIVAKCYKQRIRDDPTYEQADVEAYYETSSETGPTG